MPVSCRPGQAKAVETDESGGELGPEYGAPEHAEAVYGREQGGVRALVRLERAGRG